MPVRRIDRVFLALVAVALPARRTEPGTGGPGGARGTAAANDTRGVDDSGGTGGQDTGTADTAAADTTVTDTAAADIVDDAATAQDTGPTGPTFGEVYTQVIVAEGCNGQYCHGGLWPDEAKAYTHLTTATMKLPTCKSAAYVTPGDASKSLFWLKIDSAAVHGCGNKMPVGKKGVTTAQSKLVKDWIEAGAKP